MIAVPCPFCKSPVGIDESDLQGEWECPGCDKAFEVERIGEELFFIRNQPPTTQPAGPGHFSAQPIPKYTPPSEPEIKDDAYVYALECLMKGMKPREIRESLITSGYTGKQVDKIIQTANQYRLNSEANEKILDGTRGNSGMRNMVVGGLFCAGGTLITLFSFSAAGQSGGSYVIAWGAIIFGAIQFARGWGQSKVS